MHPSGYYRPETRSTLHKGQQLTVTIVDVARGGDGVARPDNAPVILVPFTAPGDTARVRISEVKRQHAHAECLELLHAAPDRVAAPCPVFGQCGGCQWQHLPYTRQWAVKLDGVRAVLQRATLQPTALEQFPATTLWHYRNRIQLRGHGRQLGFHASGSHRLVPVTRCEIAHEALNAALPGVRERGAQLRRAYKVELSLLPGGEVIEAWDSAHAAHGFRQVNDAQNEQLRQWVTRQLAPGQPVLDLYGGAGNLGVMPAAHGLTVHCVDIAAPARPPEGTPPTLFFHRHDVLPWLLQQRRRPTLPPAPAWSAIVDPPRGGMADEHEHFAGCLEQLGVTQLLAIGCKTDTWARDLQRLCQRGWSLGAVAVFDFFPHTHHVETAAVLTAPAR